MKPSSAGAQRTPTIARGRRLDPSRDAAILQAALDGLAEVGYDRLSMDEIAARAHAGKGALYRRWPSKARLVVDAVVAWREQFAPVSVPDTGSLRGDIDAVIAGLPDLDQAQPGQMAIFAGLATAASRDAELRAEFSNAVLERPRRLVREVLDRAIARGEVSADRDLDLVPDVLIGVNLLHMVLGEAPDRQFTARVLRSVLYPLVTGPAFEPASEPRARRTTRRRT